MIFDAAGKAIAGSRQLLSFGALPYFAGIAVAAFALGGWGGWQVKGRLDEARVLRAELQLSQFETQLAAALKQQAELQVGIRDSVRSDRDAIQGSIEELAGTIGAMRRDVRLCASTSSMQVSGPTAGAHQEATRDEPRAAEVVLQELAASIAKRCDQQAADHNSLVDWFTQTQAAVQN